MRTVLRVTGLLFAFISVLPYARATDVTGTWKGDFDFNGSSVPVRLNLTSSGNAVSGTVEGLPTTPAEIHDGKVDGDRVTFWLNSDYEGETYKLLYNGKVAANEIDFNFGTEDGSWGTSLIVKKDSAAAVPVAPAVSDVTGAWKGDFDFNGTAMPLVFNLKSAGGVLTGNVEGLGPAPVDIHDGKIEGDTVSFWLNTDYQGQTYVLTYKGKLTAGQIDFAFGTADGSWSASVMAKKD